MEQFFSTFTEMLRPLLFPSQMTVQPPPQKTLYEQGEFTQPSAGPKLPGESVMKQTKPQSQLELRGHAVKEMDKWMESNFEMFQRFCPSRLEK